MSIKESHFSFADRLAIGRFDIDEVTALSGISRSSLYRDIRDGKLTIIKDGRRTLVFGPTLQKYLAQGSPDAPPAPKSMRKPTTPPTKPSRKSTRSGRKEA